MPVNLQISNVQFSYTPYNTLTSYERLKNAMHVIGAVQLCVTASPSPKKWGGGLRTSPHFKKYVETCPPVHPQIYAHANFDQVFTLNSNSENLPRVVNKYFNFTSKRLEPNSPTQIAGLRERSKLPMGAPGTERISSILEESGGLSSL